MKLHTNSAIGIISLIGIMLLGQANAAAIPYPNGGAENPIQYSFSATNTGPVVAYFAGSGAGYDETVTILDVTTNTSVTGLQDHASAIGDSISLMVNAGDTIVFLDNVTTTGNIWSNITANNSDGANHVYSTLYAANQISGIGVSGIYVAFEDLVKSASDFNYFDDTFVFTNVSNINYVTEPTAIALLAAGLVGLSFFPKKANQA